MSKNSSRAPEAKTDHEAAKPGRDERFLARLDTHLATLAARRKAIGPRHQPKTMESAVMTEHHSRFPTPGPQQDRRLAGALLSLLVAADRRCPAIIGQAHLLY